MTVYNFSHPFTPSSVDKLVELGATSFITVPVQMDMNGDIFNQMWDIIRPFKSDLLGDKPFVVNLPGLTGASASTLVILQGLSGFFPSIINSVFNPATRAYEVVGLTDLQVLRNDVIRPNRF